LTSLRMPFRLFRL